MSQLPDSSPPRFEEALERLEKIVERLQHDDVPLEEAMGLFQEGTALTARCDELLSAAELRIQKLTQAVHERLAAYDPESSDADEEPEASNQT